MQSDRNAVLIFAQNATVHDGGEAARPMHYFRSLRARGVDAHLLVHERNRIVLAEHCPEYHGQIHFVPETWFDRVCARIGDRLPERASMVTASALSWIAMQGRARGVIRRLIPELGIGVIHQPTPISPLCPSRMHGFGVPVMIGPLNGAMDYPPAFRKRQPIMTSLLVGGARWVARPLGRVFRGLREAQVVLVSNQRTRNALPKELAGQVIDLVANAVYTERWAPQRRDPHRTRVRFVFSGRLVPFKGVDLLIEAFARVLDEVPAELEIVGDGSERPKLESKAANLAIAQSVNFVGWCEGQELIDRTAQGDVFVLPSLREAGGAVLMEAMSVGLPIIAADWGGPSDYVRPEVGILVGVESREQLVNELVDAMILLAKDSGLRQEYGLAGRRLAVASLDWSRRIDSLLSIYQELAPGLHFDSVDQNDIARVLPWPKPALEERATRDVG
jgi:glycosyltransferase involved in cell wall biosynthesis